MDFLVRAVATVDVAGLRQGAAEAERIIAGLENRARQVARSGSPADVESLGREAGVARASALQAAETPGIGADVRASYMQLVRRLDEAGMGLVQSVGGASAAKLTSATNAYQKALDAGARSVETQTRRAERQANPPVPPGQRVSEDPSALLERRTREAAAAAEERARTAEGLAAMQAQRAGTPVGAVSAEGMAAAEAESAKIAGQVALDYRRKQEKLAQSAAFYNEINANEQEQAAASARLASAMRERARYMAAVENQPEVIRASALQRLEEQRQQVGVQHDTLGLTTDDDIRKQAETELMRRNVAALGTIQQGKLLDDTGAREEFVRAEGMAAAEKAAQAIAIRRATQEELAGNAQYVEDQAAANIAQRQLAVALRQQERLVYEQTLTEHPELRGNLFQQFRAAAANRSGSSTPRFGAEFGGGIGDLFSGSGVGQLAKVALPAIVGYAALSQVRDAVKSAEQLELNLVQIQGTLQGIGQGDQFASVRQSILDTAQATGVAADQVATLVQEFIGLYQDAGRASNAAAEAAKIIRVFPTLDAKTAGPQIGALAEDLGASVDQIGNHLIDLRNRTGRTGDDMLAALGQLAPVAHELNLNLDQTSGLLEGVARGSAKTGQQLGEGLARVLPEISKHLKDLSRVPGLNLSDQALGGNTVALIQDLLKQYASLAPQAQQRIIDTLGGPRNAQILAAAFKAPQEAIDAINRKLGDNNLLNDANAKAQATLRAELDRFKQTLVALGDALLRGGLEQFFKDIVSVGGGALQVLLMLAHAFGTLNSSLGGFPARLLEVVIAFKALKAVSESDLFLGMARMIPRLIEYFTGLKIAVEAETVAQEANNLVNGAGSAAAAEGGLAARLAPYEVTRLPGAAGPLLPAAEGAAAAVPVAEGATTGGLAGLLTSPISFGFGGGAFAGGASLAGAAAVALPAAAVAGALAWASHVTSYNNSRRDKIRQQIEKLDNTQLAAAIQKAGPETISYQGASAWDIRSLSGAPEQGGSGGLRGFIRREPFIGRRVVGPSGQERQAGELASESRRRTASTISDMVDQLDQRGVVSAEDMKHLQDDLQDPSNRKKFDDLNKRYLDILNSSKGRAAFQDIIGAKALAKSRSDSMDALSQQTGIELQNLDDVKAAYDAGDVSLSVYLQKLQEDIDKLKKLPLDQQTDLPKELRELSQQRSAALTRLAQFQIGQAQAAGTETPTTDYQAWAGVANNPETDQATRRTAIENMNKALQASYEYQTKHAQNVGDLMKLIRDGVPKPPEMQTAELTDLLADTDLKWVDFFTANQGAVNDNLLSAQQISAFAVKENVGVKEAATKILTQERENLSRLHVTLAHFGENTAEIDRQIAEVDSALQGVQSLPDYKPTTTTGPGGDTDAKNQQDASNAARIRQTALATKRAAAHGDPVAQAKAALDDAKQATSDALAIFGKGSDEYKQALAAQSDLQDAYDKSQNDVTRSRLELLKAQASDSPIAQARLDQQLAENAIANAHGQTEKNNAEAARTAADRSMEDAMHQLSVSKAELLKAQQTAAGDLYGASQTQLAEDQENIDRYLKAHPGANLQTNDYYAGYADLQRQFVNDQASSVQTQISQTTGEIDTDLQLKRITVGQAIQRLRDEYTKAQALHANQQQLDSIQLKINQLLDQAAQNINFSLPSDIKLPTLYEVRRYQETVGAGLSGYNDNRQVSIVMHVNNGMDQASAQRMLADAVGRPAQILTPTSRRVPG